MLNYHGCGGDGGLERESSLPVISGDGSKTSARIPVQVP